MSYTQHLRLGTRKSALAMWQANFIKDCLEKHGFTVEIVSMETKGDKILDRTLAKIGSKGVFTEELEAQLLNGSLDIVQHSAKDVQSNLPDGLELIAFTEREAAGDVLVSLKPLEALGEQSSFVIGTSSTRRVALIKHFYPNNTTIEMRGNLQTRFKKLQDGQADALLLAYAGVHRMGFSNHIIEKLPLESFTPPVGQGTIALEIASAMPASLKEAIRAACNHAPTELCLLAERAFLKAMQGGCSIPVFGHATIQPDGQIYLKGGIISLNGEHIIETQSFDSDPIVLGQNIAKTVLESGGKEILENIRKEIQA
jgi:hydroxymethylbilane synthase